MISTMAMVIEIPEELANEVSRFSAETKTSSEDVILQAVTSYVRREMTPRVVEPTVKDPIERKRILLSLFGSIPDIGDGLEFQNRIRAEWDRNVWE